MAKIEPKLFAHCSFIGTTGYNNHTRDFLRKLSELIDVKIRNFTVASTWKGMNDEPHNDEPYLQAADKKLLHQQTLYACDDNGKIIPGKFVTHDFYKKYPSNFAPNVNLVLCEINHHYYYESLARPKIGYIVWETTKYPQETLDLFKTYNQIWVASEWQKECSIKQGLHKDLVKVIPEAVDSSIFKPDATATLPEYEDDRFKFVVFGRWDYRKSTLELIESFLNEFDKDEPVDLVVSIDNPYANDDFETTEKRLHYYGFTDSRIKIKHFPTRDEYVKYLQKGHVFLSCARSEGWNLPLIEAMACGTPSIYSNCSGQLEFAKGKGLPVKIKGTIPALGGEYSTYSQSDLPGEFYQPDYEDLKKVMRDAYENYDTHKKRALKESKQIAEKFTWENAAEKAYKELKELVNNFDSKSCCPSPPNSIDISFDLGPKVEINGSEEKEYKIEFINGDTDEIVFSSTIKNNMWTKCNKLYYIPWIVKIDDKEVYRLNLKGKKVKISIDSKSMGDTLAWTPQVVVFQKKHDCEVIVSTFHNEWFEGLEKYKNIKFIKPGVSQDCHAHYLIGWFKTDEKWDEGQYHPTQPNTIPLIKTASDILGLDYKEINYGVNFKPKKRPIKEKYICLGPQATAGLKEWPHKNWRKLANILSSEGYKVVSLSLNGFTGKNIINKTNLSFNNLLNYLYHADLFIGLGSGLSWVNWVLDKKTIMINGFSVIDHEFMNNIKKIQNTNECNGCWNNKNFQFDAGDWDWCPIHKNTEKQHICQKSITPERVYKEIKQYLI